MKAIKRFCLLLPLILSLAPAALAAVKTTPYAASEIGLETVFPQGWTVVTPDTAGSHMGYFDVDAPEVAASAMRAEGIYAAAYSPEGDAVLRIIALPGDATAAQYYDIERYTPAMRTAIKNDFLDKAAWALTGYRYSEAEWSNSADLGRILNLRYTVRYGDETVARGRQAYTIRNGLCITLDMQVTGGRQLTSDENRIFTSFLKGTTFPVSEDMPLMPVGLTLTGVVPEETHTATYTYAGESTKGAEIICYLVPEDAEPYPIGSTTASSGGTFKLDVTLPEAGEFRLYLRAELEGYAGSEDARWIRYDPRRLPVSFTSYPEGDWYEPQIEVSGKTLPGVLIQCMEGDKNIKRTTGGNGAFSFTMDRATLGERHIILSMTKKGYDNRRFDIAFTRKWTREEYAKYLSSRVESLSYKNLTEKAEKYAGRQVKYEGEVLDISVAESKAYIVLGMKQDKETGRWTQRIVAVSPEKDVLLSPGDTVALYVEVTADTYAFPETTPEGVETQIDVPAVTLLTYEKK